MTTKAVESIDLPAPVAAYFAADTTGAEAVAQCFSDGAVVIDERQEHRGRTAIARWKAEASAKLILWMEADYGWDRWRAYDLLTHVARISVGYYALGTVAVKVAKEYLRGR